MLVYLQENTLKMTCFYVITLLGVIASISGSSTNSNGTSDTCHSTSSFKYIEQALANISNQLGCVGTRYPSDVGESLTGVTSLLQLSLLRELLGEYKKGSPSDKQQGPAILSRIELLLNTSIQDITSRLDTIESNVDLLLRHSNITHSTLMSIDDKLEDYSNKCGPPLLQSCDEIKSRCPDCPSGYYIIANNRSIGHQVYCYMEELCNCTGGWMRIAYLNMTDSSEKCPDEFRLYNENGVRACGRPVSSGGSCAGITFSSGNIEYSQVCGKVIGYQVGSTDGPVGNDINGAYIDGISLTHGSPRSHIWSFMSGGYEEYFELSYCPCGTSGAESAPSFVGTDYYCESGNPNNFDQVRPYINDPLWDGQGCGSLEKPCCNRPNLPWFHKPLGYSTMDSIEVRVCCNEGTYNEDVPFNLIEIYVK